MKKQPAIGFIGAGNLAQSLISGLVASGFDKDRIWCSDRHPEKREGLISQFKIQTTDSNTQIVHHADILILAIKPKDTHALILELKESLQAKQPLILSVVAGVQTHCLERWLGFNTAIVRAMPNTPALVGASATGLYANLHVTETQKNISESLLRAVGTTTWLAHEHDLDIVTILSGSGPAYFLLLMEILQKTAEDLGLSTQAAKMLTLQTALGASRLALESTLTVEALKGKIATPGGVTESALNTLETGGLRILIKDALHSAKERLEEISQLFEKE